MGKIKQGILGGFSGKVGPVVGSSWKGIPVMKSKPLSVANPRTAAQMSQRNKFSHVTQFASEILAPSIKPLRDRFAQNQSGYNSFVQDNIQLFDHPVPVPLQALSVSSGSIDLTEITSLTYASASKEITISWSDDSNSGLKLSTDKAYVLVMSYDNGDWTSFILNAFPAVASRNATTCTVTIPSEASNFDTYCVYLSFLRNDNSIVSDNSYKIGAY